MLPAKRSVLRFVPASQFHLDRVDDGHSIYFMLSRKLRTINAYTHRVVPVFDLRRLREGKVQS